jgi:hypothetical protein
MKVKSHYFMSVLSIAAVICLSPAKQAISLEGAKDPGQVTESFAIISLFPQCVHIEPAEYCTLQVHVQNTTDSMSCMECVIAFDTSRVALVSAEEGKLFEEAPFPTFFMWEHIAPDTESVVDCVLGYRSYFLPPGEIARFIFETKQDGVCPVRITKTKLWGIDRLEYYHTVDPYAWIFIGSPSGAKGEFSSNGYLKGYPNPFNPHTFLVLRLPFQNGASIESDATVFIYSAEGRKIRLLFQGNVHSGENRFFWNGRDQDGNHVASGVYFAIVRTNREVYKTKLVLIR